MLLQANQSEFREGDLVILHTRDPFEPICTIQWARDEITVDGHKYIDLVATDSCIESIQSSDGIFMLDAGFSTCHHSCCVRLTRWAVCIRG